MRIYAIGDIHGQLERLRAVETWIEEDLALYPAPVHMTLCLGDLVDRGPESPGVLNHLIARQNRGDPIRSLKGNHDRMMLLYLQQDSPRDPLKPHLFWLDEALGGRATLAAYGVDVGAGRPLSDIHADARRMVPETHIAFLKSLMLSYRAGGMFFAHAGIRHGVKLSDQAEDDLLWIRQEFLHDTRDHGALIVHGHTPVEQVTHYGNRLNLDTGAAYGRALSVAVFEETGEILEVTAKGRVEIARA